jgi:hypothetical protein
MAGYTAGGDFHPAPKVLNRMNRPLNRASTLTHPPCECQETRGLRRRASSAPVRRKSTPTSRDCGCWTPLLYTNTAHTPLMISPAPGILAPLRMALDGIGTSRGPLRGDEECKAPKACSIRVAQSSAPPRLTASWTATRWLACSIALTMASSASGNCLRGAMIAALLPRGPYNRLPLDGTSRRRLQYAESWVPCSPFLVQPRGEVSDPQTRLGCARLRPAW